MKKFLVIAFAMIVMPMISSAQFITPLPVDISVASSPTAVVPGAKSTVSWVAHNASSCTFDGPLDITSFGFPTGAVSPIGFRVVTLTSATGPVNGTITCFSNSGLAPAQAPIRVGLLPAKVVITVTASPTAVVPGDKSTVTWSALNASSCKFDSAITRFGFPIGNAAPTGYQVVAPTTATGPVYGTVTCNNNGLATSTASIRVGLLPAITITASPSAVVPGGTSTVSWTAKNKASCTFDSDIYNLTRFGFPTGAVPATGSVVVTLTSATGPVYGTITCRDIYGLSPVRAYVRVGLLPPPAPAITVSVVASSTAVLPGGSAVVTWSSTNATACTFDSELLDLARFGFPIGAAPLSGSQTVTLTSATGPVNGTLTCFNNIGSAPVRTPVRVGLLTPPPAPLVTISVFAPPALESGVTSFVSWVANNASSCTFESEFYDLTRFGFPAGLVPTTGSQAVTLTPSTGSLYGAITCRNIYGVSPVKALINIGLLPSPFTLGW